MNHDQAAHHADMLRIEQYLDQVLRESLSRPLTRDEVLDLRLMVGIPDRQLRKAAPPASSTAALETLPF